MTFYTFAQSVFAPRQTETPGLRKMFAVWRQRRQLARLDDRALRDIGIDHCQAVAEARKPLWDVPGHWRC